MVATRYIQSIIFSIWVFRIGIGFHYENLSMQYTEIFSVVKMKISSEKS